MIACICKVCCLLNFAHDRGSSTEGLDLDCTHKTTVLTSVPSKQK